MRGTVVKCPNCGASVEEPGSIVRCSYCGTQVRVQRRTGFLERIKAPEHLSPSALNLPVVVEAHSMVWVFVVIAVFPMIAGLIAFPIYMAVRSATKTTQNIERISQQVTKGLGISESKDGTMTIKVEGMPTIKTTPPTQPRWSGTTLPILRDVNGDGTDDVVGRVKVSKPTKQMMLAAYSGRDGKPLWTSPGLGAPSGAQSSAMALSESLAIVATDAGDVHAFDLASGTLDWKTRFPERVKRFCAEGVSHVRAELKDKTAHRIELSSGQQSPSKTSRECTLLAHDNSRESRPSLRLQRAKKKVKGMRARGAVARDGVELAFGYKSPGTAVPMLARLDGGGNNGGSERWIAVIPSEPLDATERGVDSEHIAIAPDFIVVLYPVKGKGRAFRLTAFDLADGRRRFDVALPDGMPLGGIATSKDAVFISRWRSVTAYDAATGALRWSNP